MRKEMYYLLGALFIGFILMVSCKEETYEFSDKSTEGIPFDPAQPVKITNITPDSGRLSEKIVITGSNFGNT